MCSTAYYELGWKAHKLGGACPKTLFQARPQVSDSTRVEARDSTAQKDLLLGGRGERDRNQWIQLRKPKAQLCEFWLGKPAVGANSLISCLLIVRVHPTVHVSVLARRNACGLVRSD
jgi:hypothetical protein